MNAKPAPSNRRKIIWLAGPIVLTAINPFYPREITFSTGMVFWLVAMVIVVVMSMRRATVPLGAVIAGLFFGVPGHVLGLPIERFLLLCLMALPFAIIIAALFAPETAGFRGRLGFFFSWFGRKKITPRPRSFDFRSLLHLAAATAVLAAALHFVMSLPAGGWWLAARWFSGGIMIFAFAETATASQNFFAALVGINAPALMRSPVLSTSIADFWSRRWNVATSEMLFRAVFFHPLKRRGAILAMFAAFLASAVAHMLVAVFALGRWNIALAFGGFFMLQPLFILAERAMKVRRWPVAAARGWTLSALAVSSPLFTEPALQAINPSLREADSALAPAAATLGFVLAANLFFMVGQFMFCFNSPAERQAFDTTTHDGASPHN